LPSKKIDNKIRIFKPTVLIVKKSEPFSHIFYSDVVSNTNFNDKNYLYFNLVNDESMITHLLSLLIYTGQLFRHIDIAQPPPRHFNFDVNFDEL